MGLALPVVGAITGVAGTLSQISNQNAQAKAQSQQIDAQRQSLMLQGDSAKANMQLQLNELARKQMYSAYQHQINQVQQQATRAEDEQNIALEKLAVANQQASTEFGAKAGQLQAGMQASQQMGNAAQGQYASETRANAEYGTQLQGGINEMTKLANEGSDLKKALKTGEDQQGMLASQMGNKQEGNISLSDNGSTNPFLDATSQNVLNARQGDMLNAVQDYHQKFGNISGDVLHQLAYSKDFSDLLKQYGMENFQATLGNIARGKDFAQAQGDAAIQASQNQSALSQQALEQARAQREQTFGIQQAQGNLNQDFYDVSLQAQGSAVQGQTAGQLAQLRAQQVGLNSQRTPGVSGLGYISAGLGAYNAVSGLFSKPTTPSATQFGLSNGTGQFGNGNGQANAGNTYGFISGGQTYGGY